MERTQPVPHEAISEYYGERLSGEVMARAEWLTGNRVELLLFDLRGDTALFHDTLPAEYDTFCFHYAESKNCFIKNPSGLTAQNVDHNSAMFDTLKKLNHSILYLPLEFQDTVIAERQKYFAEKMPTLFLAEDGSFNGYTGCNSMFGEYEIYEDSIRFDKIASTRRYCGERNIEKLFTKSLRNTVRFTHNKGKVHFYNTGESLLLELRPYR